GHSQLKTGHPVRSAIHKQLNGRLVLWWVTTGESLLLYVLFVLLLLVLLAACCLVPNVMEFIRHGLILRLEPWMPR
ncbi:hypothetical protein KCU92_g3293, partial [Aureobasidium melanogenum]